VKNPSDQSGFTLIELLVAMALVSLMAAYAFDLVSRIKDIRRIEKSVTLREELTSARNHFQDVISGSRLRFQVTNANEFEIIFRGSQNIFTTSNTLDEQVVFGNLHNLTYSIHDGNLVFDIGDAKQVGNKRSNILLKQVTGIRFSYFGQKQNDAEPKWHPDWEEKALPRLVRIEVEMDRNSGLTWLPMDIAMRAANPVITPAN
jgi:prepilin-type N-terminal cleavage/methylation domain-containing protein